jgi:hypothetical protein
MSNTISLKIKITFIKELLSTESPFKEWPNTKNPLIKEVPDNPLETKLDCTFQRTPEGEPMLWDYQIHAFIKDAAASAARLKGGDPLGFSQVKRLIDGYVFVRPRRLVLHAHKLGVYTRHFCRTCAGGNPDLLKDILIETVPVGSWFEAEILLRKAQMEPLMTQWLDYGETIGLGQGRRHGKGQFAWEMLERKELSDQELLASIRPIKT